MRRREFIALLGGAAAWPLTPRAQQPGMPVVGFLGARSPEGTADFLAALRAGLGETGFIEDRNVMIEFRWAEDQYDRLPALARDLVTHQAAAILTQGVHNACATACRGTACHGRSVS